MVGIIREIVRFQALREGKYSSPTPPACLGKLIPVVGNKDHPSVQLSGKATNRDFTGGAQLGSQRPQLPESFRRFRADGVVRIHIGRTNNPLLIDHVSCGYRQSIFRLIVESVQRATE
jgi:hypothetical protein